MKSIKDKHLLVEQGKLSKQNFVKEARQVLPNLITSMNSYGDVIKILKSKSILENKTYTDKYQGRPEVWAEVKDLKKVKTNESYGSSNDFGGPGLIVVGKTRKDNNLIDQATEESDFYGIYNKRENYWFFPEGGDQATIDRLENELETIFIKKGANVRYEAQYESRVTERVSKIACLECDEVNTEKVWKKNKGFCPSCKTSTQGVAESVVTEGRSINKIQKDWSQTTTAMSQKVDQWKSAEGDRKIELLDELKALTAKKRALESELDAAVAGKDKDLELVVGEGNAFGAARAEAIAKGEKEFTVDGETYPVESVDDEDKTNAEEFVKESKNDLWNYLIEKHAINEDLRTDIKKYIKSNKKEIDAMADQDNWEGIYSMLMKDFEVREDDVKMADEIKTIFNIVY